MHKADGGVCQDGNEAIEAVTWHQNSKTFFHTLYGHTFSAHSSLILRRFLDLEIRRSYTFVYGSTVVAIKNVERGLNCSSMQSEFKQVRHHS